MSTETSGTESSTDVSIREKRARWEGYELRLLSPFTVLVRNVSHSDPSAHEHVVSVVDGEPTSCTCKDYKYRHSGRESVCKHCHRVESEPAVLLALGDDR
jgi:hypothetical protein